MSVGRNRLGDLLRDLVSDSAEVREEAAAVVSDWAASFDDFESRVIVRVLAVVAPFESSKSCRETQINALTDIFAPGSMTMDDVAPVLSIPERDLDPSEREYIDGLRDLLE